MKNILIHDILQTEQTSEKHFNSRHTTNRTDIKKKHFNSRHTTNRTDIKKNILIHYKQNRHLQTEQN